PIIGCGGVSSGQDALDLIKAGATLVQADTAVIFNGPAAARTINRDLARLIKKQGYSSVSEAVGSNFF
ncbi:MAG: dihydroorotate dehydrogenase (quinone), partial [Alphaproteobacteria bacterium]|nr:dihydroorotate dehydrogenase (quinone) [Alphaproteobacteria bacterium]